MKNIKDYNLDDLKKEFEELGEKPYRAEQVVMWLYKEKVKKIDDMTNLSKELRNKLKENFSICNYEIERKLISNGSPIPINTILDIFVFSSCSIAIICSTISPAVKFLTKGIPVEAQNLHPILQPICDDTHTVLPW